MQTKMIKEILKKADIVLKEYPQLCNMFKKCFTSTIDTATKIEGNKTYIITGDINAMWLRDSSAQVNHYLPLIKEDKELQSIIKGLITCQIDFILLDPYANAFLKEPVIEREYYDKTDMHPNVWERKYEVDSLCYPIRLSYLYYQNTKDTSIFTVEYKKSVYKIIEIFKLEQRHLENSTYRFERDMAKVWNLEKTETLQNQGKGMPVNYTGMTWSGFRPSDDACRFHYNIPGNMFISTILDYIQEIARDIYQDDILQEMARALQFEIDYGIELYGMVDHPKYGKIFAYETDGFGNHCLMDDANVPSLLSIPYLGYLDIENKYYQNTRNFILSKDNPYYYSGTKLSGIGSPHTWVNYVWPIALTMQGLTSHSKEEMIAMINKIVSSTGGTGYCHESIDCNDDSHYTREWFCWANSLFTELVMKVYF